MVEGQPKWQQEARKYSKTIPTFLSLLIFGFVYDLVLVADALYNKNSIQLIGLCLCNVGLMVYGAVQISQIEKAVSALVKVNEMKDATWHQIRGCLIAIPIVIGVFTLIEAYMTWELKRKFGWQLIDATQGSLDKKRGLTTYQFCFLGGLAYFIFKMVRMYYGPKVQDYDAARKSLTFFAAITILLILVTIANACMCYRNFGQGLTDILGFFGPKLRGDASENTEMGAQGMSQNLGGRAVID
ncbi:hypothetical protein KEM54_000692 [Ascosphaera aggregata]|nr:hypothetical protein KEM54_000692 [Ascosphaera aggregata]